MGKKLYDLSNPQLSIWATEQFYSGTNVNNICGTVLISDTLNANILKQAIINVKKTFLAEASEILKFCSAFPKK